MAARPSRLGDTVFAFVHMALLAGALVLAVLSLLKGDTWRFLIICCCLLIYYVIVLDKPLRQEIARRQGLRREAKERSLKP
jgi:hypothetical protein